MKSIFWKSYLVGGCLAGVFLAVFAYRTAFFPVVDYRSLELFDMAGRKVDMTDFDTRPLVVNYWATWCRPCLEEFPSFEEQRLKHGGRVAFVMISDDPPDKARRYVKRNEFGFRFLLTKTPLPLNVRPVTYFYDAGRGNSYKHVGELDEGLLRSFLEKIE